MISLLRRHTARCAATKHLPSTELRRCNCPLMANGTGPSGTAYNHKALGVSDVYVGREMVADLERGKTLQPPPPEADTITVTDAWERFSAIMTSQRNWAPGTIEGNVRPIQRSMERHAKDKGVVAIRAADQGFYDSWIGSWTLAPSTRSIRLGTLREFLRIAAARKWIAGGEEAIEIFRPKYAKVGTTQPFQLGAGGEDERILAAAWKWETAKRQHVNMSPWMRHPRSATGFIYLLRYTGLRFSDAMRFNPRALERRTVRGQSAYCYLAPEQIKTGEPVFLPIADHHAQPIVGAHWLSSEYAFWDGRTETKRWNQLFRCAVLGALEQVSGVAGIHPHRWRDTFSVDLLSRGVDIRAVSRLLGHRSVATTLQHYEHWVQADQDALLEKVALAGDRKVRAIR